MNIVNKEMLTIVTNTMIALLSKKDDMRKLVRVADVEAHLLQTGIRQFVPVTMCLKSLIQVRYVRYYKLDNGELMYGFTKLALSRMNGNNLTITNNEESA